MSTDDNNPSVDPAAQTSQETDSQETAPKKTTVLGTLKNFYTSPET